MTPEQFCYWLQGRAELQPDTAPSDAEWAMIREHLQTVFVKVTPPLGVLVKEGPDHQIRPNHRHPNDWWPSAGLVGGLVAARDATIAIC